MVAYNGNLSLFLIIYEKGTNLGQITDLQDLKRCYFYFIEQGVPEARISKIFDTTSYAFIYQAVKETIDQLKTELLPMLGAWDTSNGANIWTDYLHIVFQYNSISPYFPEDYLGDFIVWNTSHLNYAKFLSFDVYGTTTQKWEATLKLEHKFGVPRFAMRDALIKALLRNGYVEIVKFAVSQIRNLVKNGYQHLRLLDQTLAEESTLEEFRMLGGNLKSFNSSIPRRITNKEMFEAAAEINRSYIPIGYVSMTPHEWLSLYITRSKILGDSRKKKLIQDAIDDAKMEGYFYWALTVEQNPIYAKLKDL